MQAADVTNRLRDILSFYTDDFSNVQSVTSLVRSASTVTATTATDHSLTTGDYVTLRGAKEPITLSSLTRVDNIVTATSSSDHKLSDPSKYGQSQLPIYVEISGADPSDYNGTFELVSVPDTTSFTFKISTTPTTPATTAGTLLLEDQDGYNGYKQITVIDTTSFSYSIAGTPESPAQGTIEVSKVMRVDFAATPERILEYYSENSADLLETWMFVYIGGKEVYKDGTVASDQSTSQYRNRDYWYQANQNFSVYVIIPSTTNTLGGLEADKARTYEEAILKAIANYEFSSQLSDVNYQPAVYVGNETDDYINAYYVHRFDFVAQNIVRYEDTAQFNNGAPLQVIDGTITDKDMTFKPNLRS